MLAFAARSVVKFASAPADECQVEQTVRPSGVQRHLGEEEVIVTKTDVRGRITYANDVFLRISAYDEAAVLGRPHNLVRHPDMPRCVFKLLWDTIAGGSELFAYVLNLAGDGAHYWVFAHVTPSYDHAGRLVGYHSNRRRPDAAAVDTVASIYRQLLAAEARFPGGPAAIAAGATMLEGVLGEAGASYEQFVWRLAGSTVSR